MEICDVCEKDANHTCGQCGQVAYCSVECQSADWPEHRDCDCTANHEDLVEHMGAEILEPGYFMSIDGKNKERKRQRKQRRKDKRKNRKKKNQKKGQKKGLATGAAGGAAGTLLLTN
jgi:hypothetical protein